MVSYSTSYNVCYIWLYFTMPRWCIAINSVNIKSCRIFHFCIQFWRYKLDNVFAMYKVNSFAQIHSSVAYSSPKSSLVTNLLVHILQEHCNDFTYLACMANIHCWDIFSIFADTVPCQQNNPIGYHSIRIIGILGQSIG